MRYVIAVFLLAALAGCGADEASNPKSSDATESPTPSSTATTTAQTTATLQATCPLVEAALPADTYDDAAMTTFLNRLAELNNAGDTETRNALRALAEPTAALAGGAGAEDHLAFLDALDSLAQRCATVGSSALQ